MRSNENNFIQRLQRKKEDALEFVIDTYLPLIKGTTYKVLSPLKNDGIIEECINDIFLTIWNNAKKFSGDAADFKKWIYAIAKFKAIDYYRKNRTKTDFITNDDLDFIPERSAEDELILREDQRELIHLINQLEPVDRDIFIMKFFLGLKTEDISQKLGLTRAAIDNRIYRGKKRLYTKAMDLNMGGQVL
ncbi:sigma-70 family RNA polymerase sigma factor [Paenibacillus sp. KQZ6P-2]|uniref:Sigma-70 family RNA polymerase sigma factor n=1 Tax=Paenibacillus mangrovi TaxID=2931978 RepID=A0A9X1WPD6_9BACL|nr:sigma-70 family RNA polymerase sigma factor [Paenibacillus mangrovi]MCJ8012967.1 sigma-70 family RNA polymerase sigma factor [Paenibacillus mangrovi]